MWIDDDRPTRPELLALTKKNWIVDSLEEQENVDYRSVSAGRLGSCSRAQRHFAP